MEKRIIVLVGPEGSGKTTQAKLLSSHLHLPHIATGSILREIQATDTTELGDAVRKMFAENGYLPAKFLFAAIKPRLEKDDTKYGFILDGGMRTVEEIKEYRSFLKSIKRDFKVIILKLEIPEDESFSRLVEGRKRVDDTDEGVKRRLTHYLETLPEREKLMQILGTVKEIDGFGRIEEVQQRIREVLTKI